MKDKIKHAGNFFKCPMRAQNMNRFYIYNVQVYVEQKCHAKMVINKINPKLKTCKS